MGCFYSACMEYIVRASEYGRYAVISETVLRSLRHSDACGRRIYCDGGARIWRLARSVRPEQAIGIENHEQRN